MENNRTRRQRFNRSNALTRAWSLLELLLVLGIITLLLAFMLPRWIQPASTVQSSAVAQQLLLTAQALRDWSALHQQPTRLYLDDQNGTRFCIPQSREAMSNSTASDIPEPLQPFVHEAGQSTWGDWIRQPDLAQTVVIPPTVLIEGWTQDMEFNTQGELIAEQDIVISDSSGVKQILKLRRDAQWLE